jgi:hypothetical protein
MALLTAGQPVTRCKPRKRYSAAPVSAVRATARRKASAGAARRPAEASRCARVVQNGWNRTTAGSSIRSSARNPAFAPSIWPSTAAKVTAAPSDGATRRTARWCHREDDDSSEARSTRARHNASMVNTASASQISAKPSHRAGGIGSWPTTTPQVNCIAGVR